jgi:medium-chain acyl-[acyl-carrier-protein] hydrolase
MEPLIAALADAIQPHLAEPFAFFGHSMGAAVAFELARELRRRSQPGPFCMMVSAARAPQFRLNHVPGPEPSDAELIEGLRSLQGAPVEVLENRELMQLLLPALRADTSLYRNYIYAPEPPLACPIRAFGGADDPSIRPEHLEAWREQTSSSFDMRLFPGGHFFFRQNTAEFLDSLAAVHPPPSPMLRAPDIISS